MVISAECFQDPFFIYEQITGFRLCSKERSALLPSPLRGKVERSLNFLNDFPECMLAGGTAKLEFFKG